MIPAKAESSSSATVCVVPLRSKVAATVPWKTSFPLGTAPAPDIFNTEESIRVSPA